MAVFCVERIQNYAVMCNYHSQDKNRSLKAKCLCSVSRKIEIILWWGWPALTSRARTPSRPPWWNWKKPGASSARLPIRTENSASLSASSGITRGLRTAAKKAARGSTVVRKLDDGRTVHGCGVYLTKLVHGPETVLHILNAPNLTFTQKTGDTAQSTEKLLGKIVEYT